MINKLKITNFKSIVDLELNLSKVNVFIGENGCGKSNILEAVGMLAAAKANDLEPEELFNRGIRVARPSLTTNSFAGKKTKDVISFSAVFEKDGNETSVDSKLESKSPNDIYMKWEDQDSTGISETLLAEFSKTKSKEGKFDGIDFNKMDPLLLKKMFDFYFPPYLDYFTSYLIYNINTMALRGITNDSRKQPLGINGEGLDILIQSLEKSEFEKLNTYQFISWLKTIEVDEMDLHKHKGHKLGRSTSRLYFTDKYMKKDNNLFSAENANEGALHVLFYLTLMISKKTPQFFAIDNIETALNPKLCRDLMQAIAGLAAENDKQVLITTHNPAILDGMNLNDPNQKLFVVKRKDDGQTAVDEVKMKPDTEQKYKLSELWMRGYIGGLPNNF